MSTNVILFCGPAAEDTYSFEDLVDAEFKVVQRIARHYGKAEPATIKDLKDIYKAMYVAPFRTCIKAAGLWALDAEVDSLIHSSVNYGIKHLTREECESLCNECGLMPNSTLPSLPKPHLMFMPEEAKTLVGHESVCFTLTPSLLDIVAEVQRATEEAAFEVANKARDS